MSLNNQKPSNNTIVAGKKGLFGVMEADKCITCEIVPPTGENNIDITYTPGNSANWVNPDPTTVQQALDRIAAAVGPIA